MKLFSYEDLGAVSNYSNEIYIGCLILSAVIVIVAFIWAFKCYGAVKKILAFLLSCAIAVGLWYGCGAIKDYNIALGEVYARYKAAYENGEVMTVRGQVVDFIPATASKTFTVDGVTFKILPSKLAKPTEGTSVVMYYTYKEAHTNSNLVHNAGDYYSVVTSYTPENCVILGDNQWVEIQYVFEDGENRILYIAEIEPEN